MSFFAVLFALLIEQARPLARGNWIHAAFRSWARWTSRNLDAGKPHHGWIAWLVAALLPSIIALAVHLALWFVNPVRRTRTSYLRAAITFRRGFTENG